MDDFFQSRNYKGKESVCIAYACVREWVCVCVSVCVCASVHVWVCVSLCVCECVCLWVWRRDRERKELNQLLFVASF